MLRDSRMNCRIYSKNPQARCPDVTWFLDIQTHQGFKSYARLCKEYHSNFYRVTLRDDVRWTLSKFNPIKPSSPITNQFIQAISFGPTDLKCVYSALIWLCSEDYWRIRTWYLRSRATHLPLPGLRSSFISQSYPSRLSNH